MAATAAPPMDMASLEGMMKLINSDGKAFFETSQHTIKQNKDLMASLRRENKEHKATLKSLSKALEGVNDSAIRSSEISLLDDKLGQRRRRYDDMRAHHSLKLYELKRSKQQLASLQKESEPVLGADSSLTRKIQLLENRLDKSLIKFNEAQSIRKTYEQIVKRLQEERIGFDNQLAAIERTLKAKDHDYRELLNMSHDAGHAKEIAKAELAQFRAAYEEERRQKERELQERKAYVQSRVEQTDRLEKREKARRAQELETQQRVQEEKQRIQGLQAMQDSSHEQHDEAERERLDELAQIVDRIKEVAGVSTVGEVVKKFQMQEDTHRSLEQVTLETQESIAALQKERATWKGKVEELKWSATAQLGSRRIVEEFEAHLADAQARCERSKAKYERVAKLFINAKAGVEHLYGLLSSVKLETLDLRITDDNVVDAIKQCESKLLFLMEEVVPVPGAENTAPLDLSDLSLVELPAHNKRVKTEKDADDSSDDEEEDDEEEDVLDRNMVKKLAALAVAREAKKAKKRGKRGQKEEGN